MAASRTDNNTQTTKKAVIKHKASKTRMLLKQRGVKLVLTQLCHLMILLLPSLYLWDLRKLSSATLTRSNSSRSTWSKARLRAKRSSRRSQSQETDNKTFVHLKLDLKTSKLMLKVIKSTIKSLITIGLSSTQTTVSRMKTRSTIHLMISFNSSSGEMKNLSNSIQGLMVNLIPVIVEVISTGHVATNKPIKEVVLAPVITTREIALTTNPTQGDRGHKATVTVVVVLVTASLEVIQGAQGITIVEVMIEVKHISNRSIKTLERTTNTTIMATIRIV